MTDDSTVDAWDPLHSQSPPSAYWSTGNFGEAMPGVMTPLGWTLWGPTAERATRRAFSNMGALARSEAGFPKSPDDRVCNVFYGRVAGRVDFLVRIGDRLPGTTGAAVAEQVVGAVPPELTSTHTKKRYPIIALKFPYTFATITSKVRRAYAETNEWWSEGIGRVGSAGYEQAMAIFRDAARRFDHNVMLQGTHVLCAVQPVFEQLSKLVKGAGMGDATAFMSGYGQHAESAIVTDMWAASRGHLALKELVRRHGYHGPREGEISGRVWREDDTALRKILQGYKELSADSDPAVIEERKRQERQDLERKLLGSLPVSKRPAARLVLRSAAAVIPVRGVGKVAFLQSLDMARAAARRIGYCLVERGILSDPEDVFYLTFDELGSVPADARELVSMRRDRHAYYETLEIPAAWLGQPVASQIDPDSDQELVDKLDGVGVSPGVVEGVVRIVADPDDEGVEGGEILVAPTTDPSWASIMYLSKALVVDIGGALSHAAIVARELGIPCVVNTKVGTRALRTGDTIRVDGGTGRVEVLKRST